MSKIKASYLSRTDFYLSLLLQVCTIVSVVIVLLIFAFLINEIRGSSITGGLSHFFTDTSWNPTQSLYGLLPMIGGSIFVTLGSVLLVLPIAMGNAAYLRLHGTQTTRRIARRCAELLAGIPSVVFGFWGLVTLVPLVNKFAPPGAGLFTASIVLAMMILPTLSLIVDNAFHSVSDTQLNNARSLGVNDWQILRLCLFPNAARGIWAGIILSVARAIGETMAVLMVCGNIVQWPTSLFSPVRTLTANIALELGYAEGLHRTALFVSGFVLMIAVSLCIFMTAWLERRRP